MIVSFKISFDSINQLGAIISPIITNINSKSINPVNAVIYNQFNSRVVNFKYKVRPLSGYKYQSSIFEDCRT